MIGEQRTYDVVVCGGGLAGVCAAIAAARAGARTALIQNRPVLGGNSSSEGRVPVCGAPAFGHNRAARETGIIDELRTSYYGRCPQSDNRAMWDLVLKEACDREASLEVFLNTSAQAVRMDEAKEEPRIASVIAYQSTTESTFRFDSEIFVDATGDGFIAAGAGAAFRVGREGTGEFGEALAPAIADAKTLAPSLYMLVRRRDYAVPFSPPAWARKYTSCSDLPPRPHTKEFIEPACAMASDGSEYMLFWWLEGGGECDVISEDRAIYDRLLAELMGVWDHLKNHCDAETRAFVANYELVWWPPFPLRRESRRVEGDLVLTECEVVTAERFPDRVAYGGWPIDHHPPEGLESDLPPCDLTFLNELYSIPLRSLYSRDVSNLLLAGRCISVSHVALGTVRVQPTLAVAGQAVGAAGAICVRNGCTPRELSRKHVGDLQQLLLREDAYIIGLRNEDPLDLARQARLDATSSMSFSAEGRDGVLELKYDTAQQLPVSTTPIRDVSVWLQSSLATAATVNVSLLSGPAIARIDSAQLLYESKLVVPPHSEGWFSIGPVPDLPPASLLWICLGHSPGVYWGFSKNEMLGSRYAVKYDGEHTAKPSYHGSTRILPRPGGWIPINHHGRLPDDLATWTREAVGSVVRPGATYELDVACTMNVKLDPAQCPYSPDNVVNGVARPEDGPNLWISDPEDPLPQSCVLRWEKPISVCEIHVVFDTSLDHVGGPANGLMKERKRFAFPPPACVRDYELILRAAGATQLVIESEGNVRRRVKHALEQPVSAEELEVRVLATHGDKSARIYEVRVYQPNGASGGLGHEQ